MSIQPTAHLEYHPHQEFHFADDTSAHGCCCFWRSRSNKKPKKYFYIDKHYTFKPRNHISIADRVKCNQRLREILELKFEDDPIDNDEAFERLKKKVEFLDQMQPITEERLIAVVKAMYEIKFDIRDSQ